MRTGLLYLPNIPAEDAPDGSGEEDNVELRRWWPGQDLGRPEPQPLEHQRVPHWEIGEALQILDMERGARLAGSMFPLYRGPGARLLRALTAFAIDRHSPEYEEILPPTVVLTETMTSTGHLPKFADDAYHIERDDLWLIPTAEVPLTSMHRGEILEESELPLRFTAATACYRREAGCGRARHPRPAAGARVLQGRALRVRHARRRARSRRPTSCGVPSRCSRTWSCPYRVLDLCTGDLGGSSARTFDLEVYSPGVDRWLEVSSVSWFRDYQARGPTCGSARPAGGTVAARAHRQRLGAGVAAHLGRLGRDRAPGGRDRDVARGAGAVSRWRAADQGAVSQTTEGGGFGFGFDDAVDAIAAQSRRLADVVASSDLDARVPHAEVGVTRPGASHRHGAVVLVRERAGEEPRRTLRRLADRAARRR